MTAISFTGPSVFPECQVISSTERKYQQDFHTSREMKTLLEDSSCPRGVRDWLISYYAMRKIGSLESENRIYPKIIQPKATLLGKVAEYYKNKYQIEIQVCNTDQLLELLRTPATHDQPIGILLTGDLPHVYYQTTHVTPLILYFTKEKKEALILDTLAAKGPPVEPILTCFQKNQIITYSADAIRQADTGSCRTDAIVILRNVLLDFKYCNRHSKTYDISAKLQKIAPDDDSQWIIRVAIPLEWDYTSQISNKSGGDPGLSLITRDFFSASESKRANPRTVEQFRSQHTEGVIFQYSILELTNFQEMPFFEGLPSHIHTDVEYPVVLSWSYERRLNTYLVHKAFKIAKKLQKIEL